VLGSHRERDHRPHPHRLGSGAHALVASAASPAALGYRPYLATGAARERARRSERNRWLLRLGIAGLGAMQAMMFAEALFFGDAPPARCRVPMRDFLRWITFLVATPVVFYAGWPFLSGALRELRERRAGMDTLVAASTLLAYGASVVETLRGGPHVWYDAAVMFVFLLLAARMLEQRVRNVASAQVDAIARARPTFAIRERADGSRECVRVGALAAGDVVCVAAGEAVPLDGTLVGDDTSFEESLLTGESQPVRKMAGASVFAGTVCREQPARVLATVVGHGTRLSQLAALVERAQAHRPPLAQLADRIAGWFVLGLAIVAVCVFLAWRVHDPARAFEVTLALLVISCPCALSLSVPAALAAANGALARMGVLPVRADALDRLARATDVVFDKTGTLSAGVPALREVMACDGFDQARALRIACALERDSRHPLAAAFIDAEGKPCCMHATSSQWPEAASKAMWMALVGGWAMRPSPAAAKTMAPCGSVTDARVGPLRRRRVHARRGPRRDHGPAHPRIAGAPVERRCHRDRRALRPWPGPDRSAWPADAGRQARLRARVAARRPRGRHGG
jgi:Cu2+-exporting ATPase